MTQSPNTPPSAQQPVARRRKAIRVVLIASLMANVLLIGIMAGGMIRFHRFAPPPTPTTDFRSLWRALPDDARADLRALALDHRVGGGPSTRLSREERRARSEQVNASILERLRSETFDTAGFAALLSGEREFQMQRINAAREAFAARVADLTFEQRLQMADTLAQSWERRPSR